MNALIAAAVIAAVAQANDVVLPVSSSLKVEPHVPGVSRVLSGLDVDWRVEGAELELLDEGQAIVAGPGELPDSLEMPALAVQDDDHFRWTKVEAPEAIPLAVLTGLLIAADETTQPFFDRAFNNRQAGRVAQVTNFLGDDVGVLGLNALIYWIGEDEEEDAAVLAFSAAMGASAATMALKQLTGRERPSQSGNRTIFHGPFAGYESFPSGDTTAAFAMARVYGKKFPEWKYVFYGLAAGTAFARIQKHRHFLSDTFAGAVIGLYFGNLALTNQGVILKWSIWHW